MKINIYGILLVVTALLSTLRAQDDGAQREEIIARSKQRWEEIKHLRVTATESHPDQRDGQGVEYLNIIDLTNDGRYRMDGSRWYAGGPEERATVRIGNSKEKLGLMHIKDHPDVLNSITIWPQDGDATRYTDIMNAFLWTYLPCGMPLHRHHKEGATIRPLSGSSDYELLTKHKTNPVRIVLDPDHDWLPREVVIGAGLSEFTVKEFKNVDGKWFPALVSGVKHTPDGKALERFEMKLKDVEVNGPIDPRSYERPALPKGVSINDRAEGRKYINGTREDRATLIELYAPKAPAGASNAPTSHRGVLYQVCTNIGSVALFASVASATAVAVRVRTRRSVE